MKTKDSLSIPPVVETVLDTKFSWSLTPFGSGLALLRLSREDLIQKTQGGKKQGPPEWKKRAVTRKDFKKSFEQSQYFTSRVTARFIQDNWVATDLFPAEFYRKDLFLHTYEGVNSISLACHGKKPYIATTGDLPGHAELSFDMQPVLIAVAA